MIDGLSFFLIIKFHYSLKDVCAGLSGKNRIRVIRGCHLRTVTGGGPPDLAYVAVSGHYAEKCDFVYE